jgi:hypothetical protein
LLRTIVIGVHKGLGEKTPSLPKFRPGFNGQSMPALCRKSTATVTCIKKNRTNRQTA